MLRLHDWHTQEIFVIMRMGFASDMYMSCSSSAGMLTVTLPTALFTMRDF